MEVKFFLNCLPCSVLLTVVKVRKDVSGLLYFTSAFRKAGIIDFRFHGPGQTRASHLAMEGIHIRALQEPLSP